MHTDSTHWGKAGRNRLLCGPFAPYATPAKAKPKAGKRKTAKKDLLRNESEPVLIVSDRTEKSGREKKDLFPSPFALSSPRSLPISPGLSLLPGRTPPVSQTTNRSLFETYGSETRLTQVTAELQTYKQECKRLRDQLSQVLRPEPRLAQLEDQVHSLESENWDLKAALQRMTSRKTLPSPRKFIPTRKLKSPFALSTPKLKSKPVPRSPRLPVKTHKTEEKQPGEHRWTLEGLVGTVGEEEVWPLFRHLGYRMQLEGLGKEQLAEVVGGEVGRKGLERVFGSPPFGFRPEEAKLITRYLLQIALANRSLAAKDIVRILSDILPTWPVFSSSSSLLLTQELHASFRPHSQALRILCQAYDSEGLGWVRPEDFCEALEKVGISLRGETVRYLELLCYSQRKELDRVPYTDLLSDYAAEDSTAVSMVSSLLSQVAAYLKSFGLRPKDLFVCESGHIYPEGLVRGLQQVPGLVVGEAEAMAVLEALQAQESEEVCIEMKRMEQVMQALGVETRRARRFQEAQLLLHQSQASLPYIKQVSFLQEVEK